MAKELVTCPDTGIEHVVYYDFRVGSETWDIASNEYLEKYSAMTGDSVDDLQVELDWSFYVDADILKKPYREILAHIRAVL